MLAKEAEFKYPELVMPPTVERTAVQLWSNGVALDADIYRPKGLGGDRRVPAVVLSHGWGGSKSSGERYAAMFAAAGMVSLCFTHSGWASSGDRMVLVGDRPELDENNECIAKVRCIRELLDPLEWIQNYRCAVDYIEGEPNVDPIASAPGAPALAVGSPCTTRPTTIASRRLQCRSHRSRSGAAR